MVQKNSRSKKYLLLVSLDAVSDNDIDKLLKMPNFSQFCTKGTLVREVSSIFISNTYPVHTTIVTGCHPNRHGIIENMVSLPSRNNPDWHWYDKKIRVPTLYSQAKKSGLKAASIMWPVTAGAEIRYNIPEIFANRWWTNQLGVSLVNGSPLLQLGAIVKFVRHLSKELQPQLDNFSCTTMCDIIKRKKPELAMLHLTDVDYHKHKYGISTAEASNALERMDKRLGILLTAVEEAGISGQTSIILFGDHSMLDVNKTINFDAEFERMGLLKLDNHRRITSWRAWLKGCGGTAFLYLKDKNDTEALAISKEYIEKELNNPSGSIKRFLSQHEMEISGLAKECPFGFEAKEGFEFYKLSSKHKAAHGYSLEQENYKTFYAAAGNMIKLGIRLSGGCLTDIAPLAVHLLGIPSWDMDGSLMEGILRD